MLERVERFIEGHRRRRKRILKFFFFSIASLIVCAFVCAGERDPSLNYPVPEHWKSSRVTTPLFDGDVFMVESGMEHNRTVILVHGLGQNASGDWLDVIKALEPTYHVIALDLPAFGRSPATNGSFTPRTYASLLHQVRREYGHAEAAVVGHSMGGAVTLRYVHDYPEDVSQVVLVDVAGILERTAFVKHIADFDLDFEGSPTFVQRAAAGFNSVTSAIVEWVNLAPDPLNILRAVNTYWSNSALNASQVNIAMEMIDEDYSEIIDTFTHDTAIIWGEDDPVAPLRTAKVLHARIRGSDLYTFKGCGHVPMTCNPAAFNATLLGILESTSRPDSQPPEPQHDKGRLVCSGETGATYTGTYDEIVITGCKAMTFRDVRARKIVVENSSVEFEDLNVQSEATAFEATRSVIMMTNVRLEGEKALHSSGSRIDMAGVTLKASGHAVEVDTKSRLIFSVSDLHSTIYDGFVHGDYRLTRSGVFDTAL